jgi:transposase
VDTKPQRNWGFLIVLSIHGLKPSKKVGWSQKDAVHTPSNAVSLNEELIELKKRVTELDRENRHLKEVNEFLEEASAFFAASRRKSTKNRD